MSGITLAIIATVFFVIQTGFQKRLADKTNAYIIMWGTWTITTVCFGAATFVMGWPEIHLSFWIAMAVNVPLLIIANFMIIRAVQLSPLSVTIPYLALTPVFTLFTSWIILGEFPSLAGAIGILLIPIGAMVLQKTNNGLEEKLSWRSFTKERGTWYTIIVAFIWSITGNFDKVGITASSITAYLTIIGGTVATTFFIYLLLKQRHTFFQETRKHFPLIITVALSLGTAVALQMMAIQKIIVPYAISIKRAGLILGSITLGSLFFGEKNFRKKMIGGIIMSLGVLLIILFPLHSTF